MIKVLLVDDHPLFREGIAARLAMSDEIEVISQAENGQQAIEQVSSLAPDIVLMDISMPQMSGMDALEVLREKYPELNVIMLSMHDDKEYVLNVIRAGAAGYILKDVSGEEMIKAIIAVHNGQKFFSQEIATILAREDTTSNKILTTREQFILRLISQGLNNKKIAQQLEISVRTVETHKRNITKKLGINTTSGLVRYAIEHGLDK